MNIQPVDRTFFPDPNLTIILKSEHKVKVLAPWPVGYEFEPCDSGVALLHLDVFRGNCSPTSAEFGASINPVEFFPLGALSVSAEANSLPGLLVENVINASFDLIRLWLFDSLKDDLPQRSHGSLSDVLPEREEYVARKWPSHALPIISIEVQLGDNPEQRSILAIASVCGCSTIRLNRACSPSAAWAFSELTIFHWH